MVKAKLKKKKRKWFDVKGKAEFDKKIGEILAYEKENAIGRTILINYDEISSSPKNQKIKIKFRIKKVKDKELIAEPEGVYFQDSYIHQRIKRDKTRNIHIIGENSKDGKEVKVKLIYSTSNKVSRPTNAKILKHLEAHFEDLLENTKSEKLFDLKFIKKQTVSIREKVRKIYPIEKLYVWKLSLV